MNFKDRIAQAARKATEMVQQHRGAIDSTIDKAGSLASSKTGGKYEEKIRQGSQGLRTGLDKLAPARPDTELDATSGPATKIPDASPDVPAVSPVQDEPQRPQPQSGPGSPSPNSPTPER
ncbi:MAG: antitoxin [Dermatophilaceae bacterium]